jgi:hypothetical protein
MANVGVIQDSGNQVRLWRDLSGNDHNALQSDPTKQPVWTASVLNGLPAVLFDGVNDLLAVAGGPNVLGADSFTVFVIAIPQNSIVINPESTTGTAGQSGQQYVLGSAIGSGATAGACPSGPTALPITNMARITCRRWRFIPGRSALRAR